MSAKKYRGSLGRPIRRKSDVAEVPAKLNELCDHHGVERGDWFALSLALAREHVPGLRVEFEPEARGGRPTEWNDFRLLLLWFEVETLLQNGSPSVRHACDGLATTDRWCRSTGETLRARYERDARKSALVVMLRDIEYDRIAKLIETLPKELC